MIRRFLKCSGVFAVTLAVCAALLWIVCALIPQSAILPAMQEAEAYFSAMDESALVLEGNIGSRKDEYADIALFDVIYHVDAAHPFASAIAAPYYRTEGEDIREDFRRSVVEGVLPNSEYSRYWHGSQVLLRPLLTFTSIEGCRAALFGLLLAMNVVLAAVMMATAAALSPATRFPPLPPPSPRPAITPSSCCGACWRF